MVGLGSNSPIGTNDPTAHAEILALRDAAGRSAIIVLNEATVFCTLEPCVMCAGALVAARVKRLVFAARDIRFGAVRSKFRLADSELLNHRVQIEEGLLAAECGDLLRAFLQRARQRSALRFGPRILRRCGGELTTRSQFAPRHHYLREHRIVPMLLSLPDTYRRASDPVGPPLRRETG